MSIFDIWTIQILQRQGYKVRRDSTLKCWKKKDLIALIRILENNWAAALERCENQYKQLCRYHERQDKYRWHDLRKDPEDLPEDALSSVVAWDKNMNRCVFAQHTGNEWVLRGNGGIYFPEVIAWRYIEPFEEVEG